MLESCPGRPSAVPDYARDSTRIIRTLPVAIVLLLTTFTAHSQDSSTVPAASLVTLTGEMTLARALGEIRTQTGIEVKAPSPLADATVRLDSAKRPFWEVLEAIADRADAHIVVGQRGAAIGLAPGRETRKTSIVGPFRVVPREVRLTRELSDGRSQYFLTCDIHWEPNFPVFRMDDSPATATGSDDLKNPLSIRSDRTRSPVSGYSSTVALRILGLTRKSQSIRTIDGEIVATLASRMLRYTFDSVEKADVRSQDGVGVTLEPSRKDGFHTFKLTSLYPKGFPSFESYEESVWQKNNALTLVAPDGTRHSTTNMEASGAVGGAVSVWRFSDAKTGLKPTAETGWKVEFSTPSPLREVSIRTNLTEIELP